MPNAHRVVSTSRKGFKRHRKIQFSRVLSRYGLTGLGEDICWVRKNERTRHQLQSCHLPKI